MEEIGAELRRRQEELGLSLKDVQGITKIRVEYLEAIETGNPEKIPGEVFVKGFLKAYAGAIGLDGQDLVERYKAWRDAGGGGPSRPTADRPSRSRPADAFPGSRRHRPRPANRLWGMAARAAFLVAMAALFYVLATATYGGRDTTPHAQPQAGRSGTAPPPASPPAPATPPPAPATPAPPEPAVTVEKSVYGRRVTYQVGNVPSLRVEADLTGLCWVRVHADGRLLFEGMLRPGDRRIWEAQGRLSILAGRPVGLRLAVNGIPLEPLTGANPLELIFMKRAENGPPGAPPTP